MKENVLFLNMFPDYVPPEPLDSMLSQAAISAADLDPASRRIDMVIRGEKYIPQRLLELVSRDIAQLYGLNRMTLQAAHPADQIAFIERDELMGLFVSQNSMTRGSLAGAEFTWQGTNLTIKLVGNGKAELEASPFSPRSPFSPGGP